MDYCNTSNILQSIYVFKVVLNILFIIVPIIMIINATIRTVHIVTGTSNEEEIKKNITILIKNIIAGIIIYLMPTIITSVIGLADSSSLNYCLERATLENIKELKLQEEQEQLREKQQTTQDLNQAAREREEQRQKENENVQQHRPQGIKDAKPGMSSNVSNENLEYWEFIPDNPKTNMALVIFLHGSGECGNLNSMISVSMPKFMNEGYYKNYNAVFIAPNTKNCNWGTDASKVKALIDEKVEQYSIDPKHIIITGHSLGGNGTWNMIRQYPGFFSAAVPVSGCPNASAESYLNIPIRSYVGSAEGSYQSCNSGKIQQINNAGGNAEYIIVPNTNHSTVVNIYKDSELINWMLKQ